MNIENLTKLANYLDNVKQDNFHMEYFQSKCGTVACAAGYLPAATGIEVLPLEWWGDYIERVTLLKGHLKEWQWCFGMEWMFVDNTPQGASKRIRYMLENSIPDDWLYSDETVGLYQ